MIKQKKSQRQMYGGFSVHATGIRFTVTLI